MARHPCPCCGFLAFEEPVGSFAACPVCAWEDDPVLLEYPGHVGGANRRSLCAEQRAWLASPSAGAERHAGYRRDPA
jgi:hypothetical protein